MFFLLCIYFIFRTDCCTNPNRIHLKSYRDIYTSQEPMESWLHPISSSFWSSQGEHLLGKSIISSRNARCGNPYYPMNKDEVLIRAAIVSWIVWTGELNTTNKHGTCQEEYLKSQVVLCPKLPFSSTCSGGTLISGRVPGSWLILGVSLRLEEDWE